jgi:predicted nucleotidyltransferase
MVPVTLSPTVTSAIERFRGRLQARFGGRLRELTLFGSHARGTAGEESDVDVLVVVRDLDEVEAREVSRLAYFVDAEPGHEWAGLSPIAYSEAYAAELRSREKLLMADIARDGVSFG